jgi:hypothetical protein
VAVFSVYRRSSAALLDLSPPDGAFFRSWRFFFVRRYGWFTHLDFWRSTDRLIHSFGLFSILQDA